MYKSIKSSCFFLSFLYKLLVFSFAFVFYFPVIASAVQVALEWDENDETDLAGYRVFCRQEGHNYDYFNPVWEGAETNCTIFGLDDNTTYYFVARAYNTSGEESSNSNQVFYLPEDPSETCTDTDSDGYYAESGCGTAVDCDDYDPNTNPEATEICDDNKDNDCNGAVDCSDPDCDCDTTFDVTILTPASYVVVPDLQAGDEYYLDRDYYLTSIPSELATGGEQWIKTKNNDKENTSASFLRFSIPQTSSVYVAYDSKATCLPDWLNDNYELTSLTIKTDRGIYGTFQFKVYEQVFPAGIVTLGGNKVPDCPTMANYIVIVQVYTAAVPERCNNGIDDDLDGLIDCSDPDCDCDITPDVTIFTPAGYVVVPDLQAGDEYYLDRDYYLTSIPSGLATGGEQWIKTENDDKGNTYASFLRLSIPQTSSVYVAYDSRATCLPDWLNDNYELTSLTIKTDRGIYGTFQFSVYEQIFPAGIVTLGGNKVPDCPGMANYIVIVKPFD